jgi:TRAP-type C4-dicarboxylate transport system substrate-binding protein
MKKILLSLLLALFSTQAFAVKIKVGVLAPDGTTWATNLKKLSKEISKATDGKVKIKYYFGGSQGDEEDVLRKVRVGQLHGGVFTGKTLGEIYGDFRILEVPFNFKGDREKAKKALKDLGPHLNAGFKKKGFINLGLSEIGSVYFVSKKPISKLDDLKGIKIWAWQGDKLVDTFVNEMKLVSVPLALPDVLSSLSTGIIGAAYAPPLAILALQWNTKVTHLLDLPLTYSFGAFLLGQKGFNKIPKKYQSKVIEIAQKHIQKINDGNSNDNKQAMMGLKLSGIKFTQLPKEDIKVADELRKKILQKLNGPLFSKKSLELLEKSLQGK